MNRTSMTAKISMFSRFYHSCKKGIKIYDDTLAGKLLTEEEKQTIAASMTGGISFFNPGFKGTEDEALRWIVDNQLSPSPLGRAAFCERHLRDDVHLGAAQYLILAAGYDTFAYRQPEWARHLEVFELDLPESAKDKRERLNKAGIAILGNVHFLSIDLASDNWIKTLLACTAFDKEKSSFCSMLGITYYLPKESFANVIEYLSALFPSGSGIVLDYPDENSYTHKAGDRAKKQQMLAGGANEAMQASYSQSEITELLNLYSFVVVDDIVPEEITNLYFSEYNRMNSEHPMKAFDNVNYCYARKK